MSRPTTLHKVEHHLNAVLELLNIHLPIFTHMETIVLPYLNLGQHIYNILLAKPLKPY